MRYKAERDDTGVLLKIHCPDCRLTAWQHAESPALTEDEVPADEDVAPYMESVRDGCAERLRDAGCPHPMDDDAADQLTQVIKRLFTGPDPSPP